MGTIIIALSASQPKNYTVQIQGRYYFHRKGGGNLLAMVRVQRETYTLRRSS